MAFNARPENGPSHVVFAGQPGGLVTVGGNPILSPSVEKALKERFPRYRIEWLNAAWGMSGFVIKEKWKNEDPRWREVQEGNRDPEKAFDIVHKFATDTRQEDMLAFIENRMGMVKDPRKEAERMIEEAKKMLADAGELAVEQAVEKGTQRILDESDHLRRVRAGAEDAHAMITVPEDLGPKRLL